jgi:hypothetical protein
MKTMLKFYEEIGFFLYICKNIERGMGRQNCRKLEGGGGNCKS